MHTVSALQRDPTQPISIQNSLFRILARRKASLAVTKARGITISLPVRAAHQISWSLTHQSVMAASEQPNQHKNLVASRCFCLINHARVVVST